MRRTHLSLLTCLLLLTGCDDVMTGLDSGPGTDSGGTDAGPVPMDTSMADAGTDAGPMEGCMDMMDCEASEVCNIPDGETMGTCEAAPEWVYIAVVSTTTNMADLENNTPGPDLDAVVLSSGGTDIPSAAIEGSAQGMGGDGGACGDMGNCNATETAALGAQDAIEDVMGGMCDGAEDPDAKFWSMGDGEGYIIVSFGQALANGDTVTVLELDHNTCTGAGTRMDSYDVYVGLDTADKNDVDFTASDWMMLGSSPAEGGVVELMLDTL